MTTLTLRKIDYETHKEQCYKHQREWQKKNRKKFTMLCNQSRRRRVEKLREEGCTNAWAVVSKGAEPKYDSSDN